MIRYSPFLLHQFVIEADRAHKAPGDGAAVSLHISFLTSHRPPSDPIIQGGGLPTTPVILAVPPAQLAALRGVEVVFWRPGSPADRSQPRLRSRLRRPGRLAAESSTPARIGESVGTTHYLRLLVKYVFDRIQDHRPDLVASRIA